MTKPPALAKFLYFSPSRYFRVIEKNMKSAGNKVILPNSFEKSKREKRKYPVCLYLLILFTLALLMSAAFIFQFRNILNNSVENEISSGASKITDRNPQLRTGPRASRYAYVTLIHGIDSSLKYRGFLYNAIIMITSLRKSGSTADFIALVGFAANFTKDQFKDDLGLLESVGIIIHYLPRLVNENLAVGFAEMALLKVTPFSFTQYEKIQFFDGDIMPKKNMDCYFKLDVNFFCTGSASPLNSGWYLAIPNEKVYNELREYAVGRFSKSWDKKIGWGIPIPEGMKFSSGKPVTLWDFNGANLDQGLFTHYFILTNGNIGLIDDREIRMYHRTPGGVEENPTESIVKQTEVLSCCKGKNPKSMFAHFTGSSKPWLQDSSKSKNGNLKLWGAMLDELKLPYNSSNIFNQGFKPPLGYWAKN